MDHASHGSAVLEVLMAVAILLGVLVPAVHGHVQLEVPRSRSVLSSIPSYMDNEWWIVEYCPHCLNMGGVRKVSNNGRLTWPAGRRTACGDAFDARQPQYLVGGPRYEKLLVKNLWGANYHQGQRILTSVRFGTYHKGSIEMQLCVIPQWTKARERAMLTDDCFKRGPKLKQAKGGAQPGSSVWYLPNGGFGNRQYAEGWQGVSRTYWNLPDNLACHPNLDGRKCVLRMYYLTGNSCSRPNVPPRYKNTLNRDLGICGQRGVAYPEEFYNCADIRIRPRNKVNGKEVKEPQPTDNLDGEGLPINNTISMKLLPPDAPLKTCKDGKTFECFCKSAKSAPGVGFAMNPWDLSRSSYLGCDLAGNVLPYLCSSGHWFHNDTNACIKSDDPTVSALQNFHCYPGLPYAFKNDAFSKDVQCWSEDMETCARVCDPAVKQSTPFKPPALGTLTCGELLKVLTGTSGYDQKGHWCQQGCEVVDGGCPNAK